MNQPDLGLKVSELRQRKGMTQEILAERCEVSPRTIQRIESGEVDPRAYTLHCLSEALEFDFGEEAASRENLWLTILHLSSMVCAFIVPLLLWSWKKNSSHRIEKQGRQVLNFQITMILLFFAFGCLLMLFPAALRFTGEEIMQDMESSRIFLAATLCLPIPMVLVGIFCAYQGVVNAMRSLMNRPVHYPLSIPFVK